MGLFSMVKASANKKKEEMENAYYEALNGNQSFYGSELEKNMVCFEEALNLYQNAYKRGQITKVSGYMQALRKLYKADGVSNNSDYLRHQWDRLQYYRYYDALKFYASLLAPDGYVQQDSAGRYKWC